MSNEFMRRDVTVKPRFVAYFMILLTITFLLSYAVHSARIRKLNAQLNTLETQVVAANKKTEDLKRALTYRASNDYIERVARGTYGYMKPGEIRYMMEGTVSQQYLAPAMPVTFVNTEMEADNLSETDQSDIIPKQ